MIFLATTATGQVLCEALILTSNQKEIHYLPGVLRTITLVCLTIWNPKVSLILFVSWITRIIWVKSVDLRCGSQQDVVAVIGTERSCFSSCRNIYAVLIIMVVLYEKLISQKMCLFFLQSPWVLIDTLLLFHSDIDILLLEIGWLKRKVLEIEVTTTPWLERKCLKALFYTKQKLRLERRRVYLVGVIIIWHFSIVSFDLSVLILCISQNSQLRNKKIK